jgi:hypothetical protein
MISTNNKNIPIATLTRKKNMDIRALLEHRIKEIEIYLKAGKSVNQIMRLMGVTTDKIVRDVIAKYPDLHIMATANGVKNRSDYAHRRHSE